MKKIILMLTVMICLFINSNVFAKEFKTETNIDTAKAWAVRFNTPMDIETATNNIYITDINSNIIKTKLIENDDKTIIYVIPCKKYEANTKYKLTVSNKMKGTNGLFLDESFYMYFITSSESAEGI